MTSKDLKPGTKVPNTRWTVLGAVQRGPFGQMRTLCLCQCGWWKVIDNSSLLSGASKSCGCLRNEVSRTRMTRHGMTATPTWVSWRCMLSRCYNPHNTAYARYGGTGIRVCERWLTFANFFEDMGTRPAGTTLDRLNADGNYEPGNLRWATIEQQNGHLSTCRMITYGGKTMNVAAWARELDIPYTRAYRLLVEKNVAVKEVVK